MPSSIDIVLSAVDQTGPAVSSATSNLTSFANTASRATESVGAEGASGVAAFTSGIVSLSGVLTAGAIAAAAFGGAVIGTFIGMSDTVQEVGDSIGSTFQTILDGTFDWGSVFRETISLAVTGFAILEYSFKNWQTVGNLVLTSIELSIVEFANTAQYYFTEVIPAYISFFAENWSDIFTDLYNYVSTILGNMYSNLVNFGASVIGWLNGEEFDFEWTSLTDGFESSLQKLPEIAEREIGELEQSLTDQLGALGEEVGDGISANIAKRLEQLPEITAALSNPGKLLSSITGSGIFQSIFGQKDKAGALPTLSSERFTSGVQAAGKEELMLDEIRQQTSLLRVIGSYINDSLPGTIKNGVKTGVEAVRAGGIPFGG